jgi:hypothetical protein
MERLELPEFPAGILPHVDHMRDAKLPKLFNVTVQPYFAPKCKSLGDEEDDHTALITSALFPSQPSRGRLENY